MPSAKIETLMDNPNFTRSAIERAKPLLANSLSKTGSFFLAQHELDGLVGRLSENQVVDLYMYLRDESSRVEMEWRGEFVTAFPECDSALPAPTEWQMARVAVVILLIRACLGLLDLILLVFIRRDFVVVASLVADIVNEIIDIVEGEEVVDVLRLNVVRGDTWKNAKHEQQWTNTLTTYG